MILTNQDANDRHVLIQLSSKLPEPDTHSAAANQLFRMISDFDPYLDPRLKCVSAHR